ncbi:MAG TPA: hypothetical protein VMA75_01580 [Candidatus Paceibacterota bacterium]|nr:hypothetical protein [Candidatus Paceibacterota bacterium]
MLTVVLGLLIGAILGCLFPVLAEYFPFTGSAATILKNAGGARITSAYLCATSGLVLGACGACVLGWSMEDLYPLNKVEISSFHRDRQYYVFTEITPSGTLIPRQVPTENSDAHYTMGPAVVVTEGWGFRNPKIKWWAFPVGTPHYRFYIPLYDPNFSV